MADYTVLGIVNSTLDMLDQHRVADIDDTLESQQVASIAEDVFYEVVNDSWDNPTFQNLIQLESLADSTKPNYLKLPDSIVNVHQSIIKYNTTNGEAGVSTLQYETIQFLQPQDFLDFVEKRSTNEADTQIVTDFSGWQMLIYNKRAPKYCTSFDDKYIVFDSFDSDVDSVLQQSKNTCLAVLQRSFTKNNIWVIDLPEDLQTVYLQLVKARCSEYLRGEPSFTDVRKGTAGLIKHRNKQRIGNKKFRGKKYGR